MKRLQKFHNSRTILFITFLNNIYLIFSNRQIWIAKQTDHFGNAVRRWVHNNCTCRLCKVFIPNLRFISYFMSTLLSVGMLNFLHIPSTCFLSIWFLFEQNLVKRDKKNSTKFVLTEREGYQNNVNPFNANPKKWSNTLKQFKHSNVAFADELFECVSPFCGVSA